MTQGLPPRQWALRNDGPVDAAQVTALARQLSLPPALAELLYRRGVQEPELAERFLAPSLEELEDPAGMADMDAAATLLGTTIERGELIALHGDYDADGITSTALLARFIEDCGARCTVYLPDRARDGYGLSEQGVRRSAGSGARVLVALDCGTSDHETLALARELGLRCIVVDHHPTSRGLPPAAEAVLNPARPDCGFAQRRLSAVGVTFYLVVALRRWLRDRGWWRRRGEAQPNLRHYLDLVTLGTVADVVPLLGQNRILVHHGLDVISRRDVPGLAALCRIAGLGQRVSSGDIAFKLAPRINASGRVGQALAGFQLLRARTREEAERLATLLESQNNERKRIQERMEREAIEQIEALPAALPPALVVAQEGWHQGVVGIVASRLVDRYHRPAVVVALDGGRGRGSARSVLGVDIGQAIQDCREHILEGGGHSQAAGVALSAASLQPFREALCARVEEALAGASPQRLLAYDVELPLEEVDEAFVAGLERLGPFGEGHPEPVLVARNLRLEGRRILKEQHLRCRLRSGDACRDAIGFRLAEGSPEEGSEVRAAFTARIEEYRGETSLRLQLKDLRREGDES